LAETYASWIHALKEAEVVNIFNDYHIFGLRNPADSGIFDFMDALPGLVLANPDFSFATCSEIAKKYKPAAEIDVPEFMSWDDEGRDLTAWLGNDMQKDAIHSLYALTERVRSLNNEPQILQAFERLQTADHFHNMSTKWFTVYTSDRPNPFPSPYDAYITFMNVLADLELRIGAAEAEQEKLGLEGHAKRKLRTK
ncbi:MAG: alpha-amylase, partial [Desulfovibrio sp.]|nr:alpha-amylase [Desulfovibrio sp.]